MHRVLRLDQSLEAVARAIHAVQIAPYTQEAALLGAREFPPLYRTVQDIARSGETYCGVYEDQCRLEPWAFRRVRGASA